MKKWVSQWKDYDLGYFAFHADRGELKVGRSWRPLERFAERASGQLRGKVVFFAGCSILNAGERRIEAFLDETGARVICGYRRYVFTLEAAAFELLLLDTLADYESPLRNSAAPLRRLTKAHRSTADNLGFAAYGMSRSGFTRIARTRSASTLPGRASGQRCPITERIRGNPRQSPGERFIDPTRSIQSYSGITVGDAPGRKAP